MRLKLFLQNGTNLKEKDSVKAVCSARGLKRPPNLRFLFGGEPIKASLPTREVESNGTSFAAGESIYASICTSIETGVTNICLS